MTADALHGHRRLFFPARMLAAPVLFPVAIAAPARAAGVIEKPGMDGVRERQALFRHLPPGRAQPQG